MDDVLQYYQALYYHSSGGSAQEAAAFDVLCVCDGKLTVAQLVGKLAESQALASAGWMSGMRVESCQGLLLGEYHRQKMELYQQFLAMIGSPLA